MGDDVLRRRPEPIGERVAGGHARPVRGPHVVGAAPDQRVVALAVRLEHEVPPLGAPVWRTPVRVWEPVLRRVLDHAVQRHVVDDLELSHLRLPSVSTIAGADGAESRISSAPGSRMVARDRRPHHTWSPTTRPSTNWPRTPVIAAHALILAGAQ